VIRSVTVPRRRAQGGGEPSGRRVDLRWRTDYHQAGQAAFVCEEEVDWRQAGLHGKDVDRGAGEAVRGPPLDLVPEGREFSCHVNSRFESVRAVAEDREKQRRCQPMAQEWRQAHPRGGEPLDGHKSSLGFRQPFGEVWGGRDRGGKPVPKPADLALRVEDRPIQVDREAGQGASVLAGAPVDEFRFWDGEADTPEGPFGLQDCVMLL